ncbi:MAG TPA: hypothetical protein VF434_03645 [Promineifilum sp.]
MKQIARFLIIPSILLMTLVISLNRSYAQEGEKSGKSGIRTTEYSRTELVPENDRENARLVPRTVYYLETERTVIAGDKSSSGLVPGYSGGGVNFTLSGRVSYYQVDACNFMGGSGGRSHTTSGTCVDATYIQSKTKITGPSGTNWGYTVQHTNGWPGCNVDTGWHDTGMVLIAEGSTLKAHNDHKAQVSGSWYQWLGLEDASVSLIDYSCPY